MGEVQTRSSFRSHVPPVPAKTVTRARARVLSRPLSPPYVLRAVPPAHTSPRGGRRPRVSREVRSRGRLPDPRAPAPRSTPARSGSGS
eukprot:1642866-Prymnesium_polylepis.1